MGTETEMFDKFRAILEFQEFIVESDINKFSVTWKVPDELTALSLMRYLYGNIKRKNIADEQRTALYPGRLLVQITFHPFWSRDEIAAKYINERYISLFEECFTEQLEEVLSQ